MLQRETAMSCEVTHLSKPKSDVEWMIYRAARLPGPGQ